MKTRRTDQKAEAIALAVTVPASASIIGITAETMAKVMPTVPSPSPLPADL